MSESPRLNVHQRRALARKLCGRISPQRHYRAPTKAGGVKEFDYVGIADLSNELRSVLTEVGLDYTLSVDPERHLISWDWCSIDDPNDRCTDTMPLLPEGEDRAWAYAYKWGLIRIFAIGDGEEPDEAEAAEASGRRTTRRLGSETHRDPAPASARRAAQPAAATRTPVTPAMTQIESIIHMSQDFGGDGAALVGLARQAGALPAVRVSGGVTRLDAAALATLKPEALAALNAALTDAMVPF